MLIMLLLNLILELFQLIFSNFYLPQVPDQLYEVFQMFIEILQSVMGFVWLVVPRDLVLVLIPFILMVEEFDIFYRLFVWIMKKIPFLNFR